MAEKWIIGISRVRNRITVMNVLVQGIIVSTISVYAPQCGLDGPQDYFYNNIISFTIKFGEKVVFLILEDFNRHVEH